MNDNVVQFRPRPESEPEKKKRRPRRGFGQVAEMRSGRFQASYIGPDGERHLAPVTFPTRTDAGTWLDMRRLFWTLCAVVRPGETGITGLLPQHLRRQMSDFDGRRTHEQSH